MKALNLIVAAWVVLILSAVVIVSCEKQDVTQDDSFNPKSATLPPEFTHAKTLYKNLVGVKDMNMKTVDSSLYGKCDIQVYQSGTMPDGTKWAKLEVKANANPSAMDVCAISLAICFDPSVCTVFPIDTSTLHPGIKYAISQTGAVVTNINNGKLYFAFYSLTPVTILFQNNHKLFRFEVVGNLQGQTISFDTQTQGNCEFSLDGWYVYPFTFTSVTLNYL